MRYARAPLLSAFALSIGLLSGVDAQTPTPPAPSGGSPAAKPVQPKPAAAKTKSPIHLLTIPRSTPVIVPPTPLGVGEAAPGPKITPPGVPALGNGNLPAPTPPDGPLGEWAASNSPLGSDAGRLPATPYPGTAGADGAETSAPASGTIPMFARAPEPLPALPPTPVPVLPLSILYGVILLFAGGYFWYTARLAAGENDRNPGRPRP